MSNYANMFKENPPRTLAALITLAVAPVTLWVSRWVNELWGDDPEMHGAMLALAVGVVTYLASLAGKFVQKRYTEPKHVFQELADIKNTANFSGGSATQEPPVRTWELPNLPPPDDSIVVVAPEDDQW